MKFTIASTTRLEILSRYLPQAELNLLEQILVCGLNPDTFDPLSFEPDLSNEEQVKSRFFAEVYNNIQSNISSIEG